MLLLRPQMKMVSFHNHKSKILNGLIIRNPE